MARPRQYEDAAARKAELQRARREALLPQVAESVEALTPGEALTPLPPLPGNDTLVPVRHQPHVPLSLFDSVRRGTPRTHTDGHSYVLVARGAPSLVDGQVYDPDAYAVIPVADWRARLGRRCAHGFAGWACHAC